MSTMVRGHGISVTWFPTGFVESVFMTMNFEHFRSGRVARQFREVPIRVSARIRTRAIRRPKRCSRPVFALAPALGVGFIGSRQGPWNVDLGTPPGPEGSNGTLLCIRRGYPGFSHLRPPPGHLRFSIGWWSVVKSQIRVLSSYSQKVSATVLC